MALFAAAATTTSTTMLSSILRSTRQSLNPLQCAFKSTTTTTTNTAAADDDLDLDAIAADSASGTAALLADDELDASREHLIERSRNKSRLLPQHRNMLNDTKPYEVAQSWIHNTVKYNRMQFGRLGLASGIDPRLCFATPAERATRAELERVAFPDTLPQMMERSRAATAAARKQIADREETIAKKLGKLDQWTAELNAKVAKRESDAKAARARKDRLVEEVRRQFGFKMDSRDERFQELLAQKEKEDKKKQKEEKKKLKDERMLAKLEEQHSLECQPKAA